MITLTRLDGKELVVNADHILTAEPTPDTVLLLSSGHRLMVRESVAEVIERAVIWQRHVRGGPERRGGVVLPFPRSAAPEE
jgi:flagellar protein FlbD